MSSASSHDRANYIVGYPDPFEGKEYQTVVPGYRQVQTAYGLTDTTLGIAEPCQVNTTLLDGNGNPTRGNIFLYDRDVNGSPLTQPTENLTDVYEYDYGAAPGIGGV